MKPLKNESIRWMVQQQRNVCYMYSKSNCYKDACNGTSIEKSDVYYMQLLYGWIAHAHRNVYVYYSIVYAIVIGMNGTLA